MPTKPKPFQRPSIDLDRTVSRAWDTISWMDLQPGDIVPDKGEVLKVTVSANVAVEFISGHVEIARLDDLVFAFSHGTSSGNSQ